MSTFARCLFYECKGALPFLIELSIFCHCGIKEQKLDISESIIGRFENK